jgi:hypothetical protein
LADAFWQSVDANLTDHFVRISPDSRSDPAQLKARSFSWVLSARIRPLGGFDPFLARGLECVRDPAARRGFPDWTARVAGPDVFGNGVACVARSDRLGHWALLVGARPPDDMDQEARFTRERTLR